MVAGGEQPLGVTIILGAMTAGLTAAAARSSEPPAEEVFRDVVVIDKLEFPLP